MTRNKTWSYNITVWKWSCCWSFVCVWMVFFLLRVWTSMNINYDTTVWGTQRRIWWMWSSWRMHRCYETLFIALIISIIIVGIRTLHCGVHTLVDNLVENFDQEDCTDEVGNFKANLCPKKPCGGFCISFDAWPSKTYQFNNLNRTNHKNQEKAN